MCSIMDVFSESAEGFILLFFRLRAHSRTMSVVVKTIADRIILGQ